MPLGADADQGRHDGSRQADLVAALHEADPPTPCGRVHGRFPVVRGGKPPRFSYLRKRRGARLTVVVGDVVMRA